MVIAYQIILMIIMLICIVGIIGEDEDRRLREHLVSIQIVATISFIVSVLWL